MSEDVSFTAEDLIDHHAIAAVIRDESDRILMMYHAKWGFWTLPIGKAHQDQAPLDGLVEEIHDELGISVVEALDVLQAKLEYFREGHPVRLVMHIFEVKRFNHEIVNREPTKHLELRFMSLKEIAEQSALSDATLLFLATCGIQASAPWTARRVEPK